MQKLVGHKEDSYTQEFEENSKIYFLTPADIGAIPIVNPIPLVPPLEFTPPNYMTMINTPIPSAKP